VHQQNPFEPLPHERPLPRGKTGSDDRHSRDRREQEIEIRRREQRRQNLSTREGTATSMLTVRLPVLGL
jgi:hypothetical protein